MWMSERSAKRWGSVETSSARSQLGESRAAVVAREPLRKPRLETELSVIGIRSPNLKFSNRKSKTPSPPALKRYSDFCEQLNGVVVIELLQTFVRKRQAADLRLVFRGEI